MASLRYIVPALAVASGVSAQFGGLGGSPCSASTPTTITSQAQATQLAACSTYQGSITIANGTTDNIDLSGIGRIAGDLIVEGSDTMTQFTATQLSVIDGSFSLTSLTALATLNFPSLLQAGDINWNALPVLQQLAFTQGVRKLKSLTIQNTGLQALTGINLVTADQIFVVNNLDLQEVNMQLGNVTQALTIANNGANIKVSFPNLIWAYNATIRGAASVTTPSLESVNGSLGFYMGSNEAYSAPNLTSVGGSLSFVSNSQLNNISLPELTTIGGALYVVNDTSLEKVNGFPALQTISNVLGVGSFNEFDLPALKQVSGAFNLSSTADISSSCKTFKAIAGPNSVIRGKFVCPTTAPTSTSGNGGSGTGSGSSSTPSGAANGMLVPSATGILGLVAVMFGLL